MMISPSEKTMMACGHVANAVCQQSGGIKYNPPIPSCAICTCIIPVERPDLTDRIATCYCGNTKPSSFNLAFFEFRGEDSPAAKNTCTCGYAEIAHIRDYTKFAHNKPKTVCDKFTPRGTYEFDSYYCGCRGWD